MDIKTLVFLILVSIFLGIAQYLIFDIVRDIIKFIKKKKEKSKNVDILENKKKENKEYW